MVETRRKFDRDFREGAIRIVRERRSVSCGLSMACGAQHLCRISINGTAGRCRPYCTRTCHRSVVGATLLRRLDGHVVPAAGEDVGAGGSPGAFVVGGWPVGVVEDGFDDAPFLFDGVFAGEPVSASVHGVVE